MFVIRYILLFSAFINLLTFTAGIYLAVFRPEFLLLSIILTCIGLFGMFLFAVVWFCQPKMLRHQLYFVKKWRKDLEANDNTITPDTQEAVMKNIRGIPFLIQAIQYSMETTYYRDIMSEMGEGLVRTSVIHTAPACTSVLDSDHEEDVTVESRPTPRNSAEEQWLPFGESWRNQQLRLSLERGSSNMLVFPYAETSVLHESTPSEYDLSRIESIKREHRFTRNRQDRLQVRYMGMSASFIEKFNSSFRHVRCEKS